MAAGACAADLPAGPPPLRLVAGLRPPVAAESPPSVAAVAEICAKARYRARLLPLPFVHKPARGQEHAEASRAMPTRPGRRDTSEVTYLAPQTLRTLAASLHPVLEAVKTHNACIW
jgi:hypothetical protein